MARCVKIVFNTVLLALVFVAAVYGTREIFPEKCEDQYGADLNGRKNSRPDRSFFTKKFHKTLFSLLQVTQYI